MKKTFKITVSAHPDDLIPTLVSATGLDEQKIRTVICAGGLWKMTGDGKRKKKRRIKQFRTPLQVGDRFALYVDDNALIPPEENPFVLHDHSRYGLWFKPVGVLSQGSPYGDRYAMPNLVAKSRKQSELIHPVNRLDRESSGIVLLAYDKQAAGLLQQTWQQPETDKLYQAAIFGQLNTPMGTITQKLDGRPCRTDYQVVGERSDGASLVEARIRTGRLHQVRRHFAAIGHPVMGDPRYGSRASSDPNGLQLVAARVHLKCPFSHQTVSVCVPTNRLLAPVQGTIDANARS